MNKDVCIACRRDDGRIWTKKDDSRWEHGKVWCREQDHPEGFMHCHVVNGAAIEKQPPPSRCRYRMEQIVMSQ